MLAAKAELELRARDLATFHRDSHELAHPFLIKRDERILGENAALLVGAEEAAGIIAGYAQRRLCEVVRAEGEELRRTGNLAGPQGCARQIRSSCRPDRAR